MIRNLPIAAALLSAAAGARAQTELGRAAAEMEPGEWRELATENMGPTFLETGGSSGFILGYAESMRWDSASGRAFFLGADHGPADYRIAVYDEADNSWSVLPSPSWVPEPGGGYISHGYDHLAIDPVGRRLFTRTFNSNHLRVLDLDAMSWTDAPDPPFAGEGGSCCDALDWFPELGAVVWSRGYDQIWRFDVAASSWTLLDEDNEITGTWTYAEYNPIHHVMILGSAAGGRLYRLASDGTLGELRPPPISVYDGSAWNGIVTVDPVSGDYLVLTPTARELYTFDVTRDAWERSTHQPTVDITDGGLVAAPVDTYGLTMFAHCERGACQTFLYKHSSGGGTPPRPAATRGRRRPTAAWRRATRERSCARTRTRALRRRPTAASAGRRTARPPLQRCSSRSGPSGDGATVSRRRLRSRPGGRARSCRSPASTAGRAAALRRRLRPREPRRGDRSMPLRPRCGHRTRGRNEEARRKAFECS